MVFGYAAIGFIIFTFILIFLFGESAHYWGVVRYLEVLLKLDPDLRNALALNVPFLRLTATRGKVETLFENTRATREHWFLFLQDSTPEYTASKRDWHTSERPMWAWTEIYEHLKKKKMVGTFAVGPDSYPWLGTAYRNLMVYWLGHQKIQNLNDEDERMYASDDT